MPIDRSTPVLIVDDEATMVHIVRDLLASIGFESLDAARDGFTALQCLQQRRYGLIICDWRMEPMSGYELLRRIRSDDDLKTTPFLMMTTPAMTASLRAGRLADVDAYLIKPFRAKSLFAKIEEVLTRRGGRNRAAPGAGAPAFEAA